MRARLSFAGGATLRRRFRRFVAGYVVGTAIASASISSAMAQADQALGSTLEGVLVAGRELNPQLRTAALQTEAASAHANGAGALDDPTLQVSYDSLFQMSQLSIMQDIPLWGKRDLRRSAALAGLDAARGRERGSAAELDERIKVAFAQYYAASTALDVNAAVAGVTEQMTNSATDRYARGLGPQSEAFAARAEQSSVAGEKLRLQAQQRAASGRLNTLLARSPDAPLVPPLSLKRLPDAPPQLDVLLARMRSANPLLFTQGAEIKNAEAEQQLAAKAWNPDITVGAGVTHFNYGGWGYTAMLGVKLPLQWGAKEAGEREAAANLGAARSQYDAIRAQIEGDLAEQLAALIATEGVIDLLNNQQLPELEAAYQSVLADYERGGADFRAVLEAEHGLHDARLNIIRAEVDGQTALAAIERLLGGEL